MEHRALFLGLVFLVGCSADRATSAEALPAITRDLGLTAIVAASAAPAKEAANDPSCPAGFTCDRDTFGREPPPVITEVFIQKRAHRLHLVAGERRIVRSYSIAIGSGGLGQKRVEGDRVTPVGTYSVTGRYPSRWHTYLSLSFPNDEDRARFEELAARGEVNRRLGPGSAIAIHGHRADQRDKAHKEWDWTLGCVALDNGEIDEIAAAAPVGTKVVIVE
jgi:lipoprotein-anchoring transpeptidase ErfK/SrfK